MRAARALLLLLPMCLVHTARCQQDSAYTGPFAILAILLEGNATTKDRVILRELTIKEGDTVRTTEQLYYLIERSRQNVNNLSLFNSVRIVPTYVSTHEVILTVTVSERWPYRIAPIFKLSDPNLNTWWLTKDLSRIYYGAFLYRLNMRGRNETLYAKAQIGYAKEFALRYRFASIDPRQRWGLAFGAGHTQQDEITTGTIDNKREFVTLEGERTRSEWKGDVEATFRPAFDMRHSFRLGYTNAEVLDSVVSAMPTYFTEGDHQLACFSLAYTFTYDQRDSKVYPLDGLYSLFRVEQNGLGLFGDDQVDITTFYWALQRSWRTSDRWSLGASVRAKASATPELPYYMQQGLGYSDYVRGYEYYVIDGQHYVLGKVNALWALLRPHEYTVERWRNDQFRTFTVAVYLNAFADFGRVWDPRYAEQNPLAGTLTQGYGLGMHVVDSYDHVIRMEVAVNARSETGFYLHFAQPF